jgi:hypothetical protein
MRLKGIGASEAAPRRTYSSPGKSSQIEAPGKTLRNVAAIDWKSPAGRWWAPTAWARKPPGVRRDFAADPRRGGAAQDGVVRGGRREGLPRHLAEERHARVQQGFAVDLRELPGGFDQAPRGFEEVDALHGVGERGGERESRPEPDDAGAPGVLRVEERQVAEQPVRRRVTERVRPGGAAVHAHLQQPVVAVEGDEAERVVQRRGEQAGLPHQAAQVGAPAGRRAQIDGTFLVRPARQERGLPGVGEAPGDEDETGGDRSDPALLRDALHPRKSEEHGRRDEVDGGAGGDRVGGAGQRKKAGREGARQGTAGRPSDDRRRAREAQREGERGAEGRGRDRDEGGDDEHLDGQERAGTRGEVGDDLGHLDRQLADEMAEEGRGGAAAGEEDREDGERILRLRGLRARDEQPRGEPEEERPQDEHGRVDGRPDGEGEGPLPRGAVEPEGRPRRGAGDKRRGSRPSAPGRPVRGGCAIE